MSDIKQGRPAVVLLSGGQDSVTCLFWALAQGFGPIFAMTINYGQRHAIEIEAAKKIAEMAGVAHVVVDVPDILQSTSPLVDKTAEVGHYDSVKDLPGGIEPTFIPFRNPLLLTIAANRALVLGARDLITGICQEDYGGYPDCRESFRDSMEGMLNQALFGQFRTVDGIHIHAPLMFLTKADSVRMAAKLPGCMDALAYSHTSYDGDYPPNPSNHASLLRARGFHEAGFGDPLIMRAIKEGKLPTDYPISGLVEGTKFAPQAKEDVVPGTDGAVPADTDPVDADWASKPKKTKR